MRFAANTLQEVSWYGGRLALDATLLAIKSGNEQLEWNDELFWRRAMNYCGLRKNGEFGGSDDLQTRPGPKDPNGDWLDGDTCRSLDAALSHFSDSAYPNGHTYPELPYMTQILNQVWGAGGRGGGA